MSSHSTKIVDSTKVIKFNSSIVIFAKNFHIYAIITICQRIKTKSRRFR